MRTYSNIGYKYEKVSTEYKHNLVMLLDSNRVDNLINRKVIESSHFSKETLIFTQSNKALDYLKKVEKEKNEVKVPDIIFLDFKMQGLSVQEFISEFEELSSFIKNKCVIIVLSAHQLPEVQLLFMKYKSIIDCFNKPLIKSNLKSIQRVPLAA